MSRFCLPPIIQNRNFEMILGPQTRFVVTVLTGNKKVLQTVKKKILYRNRDEKSLFVVFFLKWNEWKKYAIQVWEVNFEKNFLENVSRKFSFVSSV